jgi:multicomponent Na+:H+ antiporter subunit D
MNSAPLEALRSHAPAALIVLPWLAAVLAALSPSGRGAWFIALTSALATAALAGLVAARFQEPLIYPLGGWPAPIGVTLRIDGLAAFGLALVNPIAAAAMLCSLGALRRDIDRARQPLSLAIALAALGAVNGLMIAADLMTLFLLLQATWLGLAALTAMGAERDRRAAPAAFETLMLGAVGASLFALGAGLIMLSTGALDISRAAAVLNAAEGARSAAAGLALLLIGIGMAAGLAPLNGWALRAFSQGPNWSSLLFGAALPAAGAIGLARLLALGASATSPALLSGLSAALSALGFVSALTGSAMALRAGDLRRIAVHIGAAQAGCVAIGLAAAPTGGIGGALFHLMAQASVALTLYLAATALAGEGGAAAPLAVLDGLGRRAPFLSVALGGALLSLIGVPMTAGFLSRWTLLQATLEARLWWGAAAIILSSLAAIVYAGRLFERMFMRPPSEGAPRARIVLVAPGLLLASAVTFVFGFDGGAPLRAAQAAASSMAWGGR